MKINRRKFLKDSALFTGAVILPQFSVGKSSKAYRNDILKLSLVGSGGRGTGAVVDALRADENVELVAIADVFSDKVESSYNALKANRSVSERINVPEKNKFVGLESYKNAIDIADVVILASPPAFRPLHFETAVQANKHVFMEKALSTDAPGARRILSAGELAKEKNLNVVVGLQFRYANMFQTLIDHLKNGLIGDIYSINCNYFLSGVRVIPRQEDYTELEYQLRNWRCFEWLWGGSPAGLTIHYEDIAHWAMDSYPIRAFGVGGRAALRGAEHGNIYDNYYIEYEYKNGTRLHSRTRHIPGCWTDRSLHFKGTKGFATITGGTSARITNLQDKILWEHQSINDPNPYQTEHDVLFSSIRTGNTVNDTDWAGYSSMTSIMGRMAVQSGQLIEWDDAFSSDLVLVPDDLTFDSKPPVLPKDDGSYEIPVPGDRNKIL